MFILPFDIPKCPDKIRLKDPVFSIGSCFADNIGQQLAQHKFDTEVNPLGTIYNPYSIFKNIRSLLTGGLNPDNYTRNGDIYYHWDTHSTISDSEITAFQKQVKNTSEQLHASLIRSSWMLITLGTAKAYRYKETKDIVANCHKVPGKEFEVEILPPDDIVADYNATLRSLRLVNNDVNIILSVSPVRHVRDGLVENNYSKASLLQAVHQICREDEKAFYFPAYELMIDVLRDYRFYEADMIHPNQQAIDYIWKRFVETFMDHEAKDFIAQWQKIRKALKHKPFHPASANHQAFLKSTIKQLQLLESKVDVSPEISQLKMQLVNAK